MWFDSLSKKKSEAYLFMFLFFIWLKLSESPVINELSFLSKEWKDVSSHLLRDVELKPSKTFFPIADLKDKKSSSFPT